MLNCQIKNSLCLTDEFSPRKFKPYWHQEGDPQMQASGVFFWFGPFEGGDRSWEFRPKLVSCLGIFPISMPKQFRFQIFIGEVFCRYIYDCTFSTSMVRMFTRALSSTLWWFLKVVCCEFLPKTLRVWGKMIPHSWFSWVGDC